MVFAPAISTKAKASIREAIRKVMPRRWSGITLEWLAEKLNPKMREWINYYTKFNANEALIKSIYLSERACNVMVEK